MQQIKRVKDDDINYDDDISIKSNSTAANSSLGLQNLASVKRDDFKESRFKIKPIIVKKQKVGDEGKTRIVEKKEEKKTKSSLIDYSSEDD